MFVSISLKLLVLSITFVFTVFLPALNAFILLKMKRISSLQMHTQSERVVPYFSTALYYFALYYLFSSIGFSSIITLLVLGGGISILLTLFINYKWKISAHMIGIGGLCGALLGIIYRHSVESSWIFYAAIVAAGLVGFARLKLNAHTPAQVYSGFLLGFFIEFILLLLF
jgi:membrane-associated phospholipid phosphatase